MKSCGDCTLCCKVLHVESLGKPPGRWCEHAGAGGCAIHGRHPEDCRAFACGWLQWAELDPAWRPDIAGFLIRHDPSLGRLCVDVDPARPDAWRAAAYYGVIKGWASMIDRGEGCVLVLTGEEAVVVFPEEDIAIGRLGGDDDLAVGYIKGRGWRVPLVRRLEGDEVVAEWRGARMPRT